MIRFSSITRELVCPLGVILHFAVQGHLLFPSVGRMLHTKTFIIFGWQQVLITYLPRWSFVKSHLCFLFWWNKFNHFIFGTLLVRYEEGWCKNNSINIMWMTLNDLWLVCKKLGAVCFCPNFGKKSNTTTYKNEYVAPYDTFQPFLSNDREVRHVKEISKAWNNQSKSSFHVARKGVNIRVFMFRFSHFV